MVKSKVEMKVFKEDDHYLVSSESDATKFYRVDVDETIMNATCNCVSYYMGRRRPCKHGCKVLEMIENKTEIKENVKEVAR